MAGGMRARSKISVRMLLVVYDTTDCIAGKREKDEQIRWLADLVAYGMVRYRFHASWGCYLQPRSSA